MAACKALALKNGLIWGGSYAGYYPYFGCYAYAGSYAGVGGKAWFGTGGTETQMLQAIETSINSWIPLRVSSLDTDCLLLSNQAKLEAKLNPAFSYHTSTQVCFVAKTGAETCTNLYQIPANFKNGKAVTGTLKVGAAVTSIGTNAFRNTQITGLDLSEATALQTISDRAFLDSKQLTGTLKVGPAVTSIGYLVFAYTDFKVLDLSDATALTTISSYAFWKSLLAGQTVRKADGTSIRLT